MVVVHTLVASRHIGEMGTIERLHCASVLLMWGRGRVGLVQKRRQINAGKMADFWKKDGRKTKQIQWNR
jgi:hypothetical protein